MIHQELEGTRMIQKFLMSYLILYNPSSHNNSVAQADRIYWTTPKSWETVLWSFFSQLLSNSSSSAGLNDTELMTNYIMILLPRIIQAVWIDGTTPNSWKIILWSLFLQLLCTSSRFSRVEPPQIPENLSDDPCFLNYLVQVFQQGWITSMSWEIIL